MDIIWAAVTIKMPQNNINFYANYLTINALYNFDLVNLDKYHKHTKFTANLRTGMLIIIILLYIIWIITADFSTL